MRLTQGEVLYRDLAFIGGPLSLYFHAFLFRLFGVSLTTLIGANLCVLAVITALLWWIFRRSGTAWSATIVTVFFLAVFAFGQYGLIANYNYVCPYRHEVTHGLALGLANVACLIRYRETRRTRWLLAGGCFLGLVVLTKVEMMLAAGLTTAVALVIIVRAGHLPRSVAAPANRPHGIRPARIRTGRSSDLVFGFGQTVRDVAAAAIPLAAAAVVPTAIAVTALSRPLGWNAAWRGALDLPPRAPAGPVGTIGVLPRRGRVGRSGRQSGHHASVRGHRRGRSDRCFPCRYDLRAREMVAGMGRASGNCGVLERHAVYSSE